MKYSGCLVVWTGYSRRLIIISLTIDPVTASAPPNYYESGQYNLYEPANQHTVTSLPRTGFCYFQGIICGYFTSGYVLYERSYQAGY